VGRPYPPCRIAKATGVHGHLHALALAVRRWASVGLRAEQRTPTSRARSTALSWRAVPWRTLADTSGAWTVGAGQDLAHHKATRSCWVSLALLLARGAAPHLGNTFHDRCFDQAKASTVGTVFIFNLKSIPPRFARLCSRRLRAADGARRYTHYRRNRMASSQLRRPSWLRSPLQRTSENA
jgi:hypothetical protein